VDIVANMLSRRSFARGEVDVGRSGCRMSRASRATWPASVSSRSTIATGHHRRFKQGRLKPKLGSSPVD
jgi:hypothetical protein